LSNSGFAICDLNTGNLASSANMMDDVLDALQAVLAGGKVYTVDRVDVAEQPKPPLVPVAMPSLMWTEISVHVSYNTLNNSYIT
jgi:hypothetical protein